MQDAPPNSSEHDKGLPEVRGGITGAGVDPSSIILEEHSTERFGPVLVIKNQEGQVLQVQQAESFSNQGVLGTSSHETRANIAEIHQLVHLHEGSSRLGEDDSEETAQKKSTNTQLDPQAASADITSDRSSLDPVPTTPELPHRTTSQKVIGGGDSRDSLSQKQPKNVSEGPRDRQGSFDEKVISSSVVKDPQESTGRRLPSFSSSAKSNPEIWSAQSTETPSGKRLFGLTNGDEGGSMGSGRGAGGTLSVQETERFGTLYVVKGESGQTLGVFPKNSFEVNGHEPHLQELLENTGSTSGAIGSGGAETETSEPLKKQESSKRISDDIKSAKSPRLELNEPGPIESRRWRVQEENTAPQENEEPAPGKQTSTDKLLSVGKDDGRKKSPSELGIVRKVSDSVMREELYEFGNFKNMPWYTKALNSIERDVYNWYGSFLSLVSHGWGFESFVTLSLAVGSTCFFCYYRTPDGSPLAARLDFSIIGSALVFPVTFLIGETFRRREGAIQRMASIKAIICQIEIAMLTWRWKGPNTDAGIEWEDRVHQTLHHIVNNMIAILQLPTWNTNRHIYTAQGREFKARVIKRERELTRRLGLLFSELHWFVEDLKERGLPANEASRINQYHSLLQIDFEALAMVKSYRTPNVSRSFVRIMVLVMPIFYGPYFAWVSGSIGAGAQTNVAFAIALTIVTVIVLLGLVRVQRAMEDPFTSHFPGDVIDLVSEKLDMETRLNLIVACARERRRAKAAKAVVAAAEGT